MGGLKYYSNNQKFVYIVTAIFYLLSSQIYPYIHLHSHNHNGEVEFEICSVQAAQKLATHQCCDSHKNEHQHLLNDRQHISKFKFQENESDLALPESLKSEYRLDSHRIITGSQIYIPASVCLTSHFNKAPPQAA